MEGRTRAPSHHGAIYTWRYYCQDVRHPSEVISDHADLVWFMTSSKLTRRQIKWAESLFEYDLSIEYREGKKSPADALSRRPSYQLPELAATSSAAAHVRRLLREASSVYAPVQEKLTLAAMKLVGMRVPLMPCHSTPEATPPTTAETIQGDVEAVE
jgi:hypothetical protein